jgi:hypothetical protein
MKEIKETLKTARDEKLKGYREQLDKLAATDPNHPNREKIQTELATEAAKIDATNDAIIHALKLARVTEAMRRKQWSRGWRDGRPC